MSTEITTAFVKQFEGNVQMLAQQTKSRFRGAVRIESITGEEAYFEQVAQVVATKKTSRHGDTPLISTPHERRHVSTSTYEHADLIDRSDRVRLLIDPAGVYTKVFSGAFGRAMDDELITAALATAKTGKDGTGSEAFPSATHDAPTTAGDLSTAKIAEAKEILDAYENDETEGFNFATNAKGVRMLLTEDVGTGAAYAPAANADFAERKGLLTGEVMKWLGFSFIKSERLSGRNTATADHLAWATNSLLLAIGMDIRARISERDDKSYSTQVFMDMDMGATRMDGLGVVRVNVDES